MRMTREEAIEAVGIEAVKKVEEENVDFTNRVTDGTKDFGYVEFSSGIVLENGDRLYMYCFVDQDIMDEVEELDQIDWDDVIKTTAEFEIFD